MKAALALRPIVTALGVLALAALVWIAGPLLAIGDMRPLDGTWERVGVIVLIVLIAAGAVAYDIIRRRRAAAALESGIAGDDEEEGSDALVLQETMRDALATLKRARGGKGDYLYELPWYVIIGPPGSGKTTALVNSGLKFPLTRGASPEAVAGIGGTRYCDWWFTEDAVLIDTAGRYTTQDSDPRGDRESWLAFLDLLKENRPRQPINGVLVAISLEDLLTGKEEEINAHAAAIRKRLLELHDRLKVDFPVYAVFTKADLVAGFMEFFGHLSEADRRMVWGHTFQTADKTRNMIGEAPAEFDALIERLNEQLADKLQDEPTPTSRAILFGFPSQMAAVKKPVIDFLNRVFEPTRYHSNATLRGFYFTSGTQQGTPIDQLIGALSKSFGVEELGASGYSGLGKSFFLTDLLKKVVIGEAGWVSTNRAAVRRAAVLKAAAYGGLAVLSLAAIAAWWVSYSRNSALIAQTNTALAEYRTLAAPALREVVIADRDFAKVLPLLHKLRHMPTGYATREEPTPIAATAGLSQRERLQSASETAYQAGLERLFRARLILRLEEQLEANRANPSFLYEALKVYLMIGGRARLDRDLVVAWMRRDWAENLYPGAANARGREALEEHLLAMLDLEQGREPAIGLNGPLIEEVQRTLARLSVAERAYELLKSQARGATHRDWVASSRGGPDARLVFEATGGEDLDTVRVPYFFTYEGFHESFIDRLADIGEEIHRERWVLGEAGEQAAVQAQYGTLFADLLKLYTRDFVEAWRRALARLKLKPLTTDKPRYVALSAASAATSPIKQLLESIRDETRLTRERPKPKEPPGGRAADGQAAAAGRMAGVAIEEAGRVSSAAGRVSSAIKSGTAAAGRLQQATGENRTDSPQAPPIGGSLPGEAPGANIETLFKHFHVVVEGEGGRKAIDVILNDLNEIHQSLLVAANYPAQAQAANNALVTQVASLRANAGRFPAPFNDMLRNAAGEFEGDATGASVAQLAQALGDQVTRVCQQIVTNRYPFMRGSDREVPIGDFGRLFGPNGIMDKFFQQHLAPLVDQSKKVWTWRLDSRLARSLSPGTLREFQRAAEIRDAFFPTGGVVPSVGMTVTPLTLSADAASARFEINGQAVNSQQGVNAPMSLQWPGSGVGRTAITLMSAGGGFFGGPPQQLGVLEQQGAWSLFRMLDRASLLKQGDGMVASFVVGGREVSYQFTFNSVINPLTLPALREFRCPAGI